MKMKPLLYVGVLVASSLLPSSCGRKKQAPLDHQTTPIDLLVRQALIQQGKSGPTSLENAVQGNYDVFNRDGEPYYFGITNGQGGKDTVIIDCDAVNKVLNRK